METKKRYSEVVADAERYLDTVEEFQAKDDRGLRVLPLMTWLNGHSYSEIYEVLRAMQQHGEVERIVIEMPDFAPLAFRRTQWRLDVQEQIDIDEVLEQINIPDDYVVDNANERPGRSPHRRRT